MNNDYQQLPVEEPVWRADGVNAPDTEWQIPQEQLDMWEHIPLATHDWWGYAMNWYEEEEEEDNPEDPQDPAFEE